ncbi:MAG: ATP-binding protein, partial [Actinomycetota bacterium]|nr:ATP-binding protein [Actinomycetota bacterium]
MKLHRLTLTNYRGITHRDIEFPDHGVVVISGANEIGKSSMLEALDLLLEAKDRSTKKEVKQVKPTHADVGAEVTAEISTGPYRFVYRKRFHKRPETELTVLGPRREQLTGDEAHERVRAMLAETMDVDLWQAQRVLQSASTSAADLSGSDALSRALDVAAGEIDEAAAGAGAVDSLLIDRIDAEYRRYFTTTGRPTGEWSAATARLRSADEQVARCAAAVAEVDEAVRRHVTLTEESTALQAQCGSAAEQLAAAQVAADAVESLRGELQRARVVAEAAASKHSASLTALTDRRRARADIDERTETVARLLAESDAAAEELAASAEVQEDAEAAAGAARSALEAARERVETARAAVQRLTDREEADRLAGRLAEVERHQLELDEVQRELAAVTVTPALMAAIEDAGAVLDRATAAAEQASAQVELVAETELEVVIGAERVSLRAGERWSSGITGPAGVVVP